ncbi:MAG: beta-galactosidase trimerization domain-containing protein, partial [Armatimonadetes bacterium]|nr:beta-galactosidase trimerization domain-containing protein [Armatimonadota bacterium]
MAYQLKTRMLFCDWHMPDFLPELVFDYDDYFEGVRRTGAEALIFMCKTAHGGSLFPTEVGVTNPSMQGDIVGEVSRRAKAMGLEFIAYYNVVLSWELPKLHPEWAQLGRDGQPLRMFLYPCSCMTPEGCFCPACREKFAARFGYQLEPDVFGVREWHDLLTYQADTREAFLAHFRERGNAVRPGLSWSWNGCGSPVSLSATLHHGADYLSTEAHPPEYLHAEHATRYCEGLGLPFTLFMPESQGSWGDWTVTTPAVMKGLSAIALAHGGALNANQVPYPCGDRGGKVPEIVWDTISATFAFVAERVAHCRGKRPVPVAAVLHSADNARLLAARGRAGEPGWQTWEVFHHEHTLSQLLCENHTPWEILPAETLLERLGEYELVILPHLPYVDGDLAERLRAYVRGGGKLLVNHLTSLCDRYGERLANFALADLLGVDFVADSPYSVSYLDQIDPSLGAPAIAGLSAWYVEAQLRKFRIGARGTHPSDP